MIRFFALGRHPAAAPGAADPRAGYVSPGVSGRNSVWSKLKLLFESVWTRCLSRRGAQERRCDGSGATDGQHGRRLAKAAPKSAANNKDTLTRCRACARARATPAVTEENIVNARVLRRCYCADTFDSLRCDARSTRRAAGTRAPPQNTQTGRTATPMRSSDARRRLVSRNSAGVVGVASKHSESSRPRPRPRYSQGPSLPSGFFSYVRRRGRIAPGARVHGATKGGRDRSRALASSGGAPVCGLGTAENGRVPSAQKTQLRDAPARIAVGLSLT